MMKVLLSAAFALVIAASAQAMDLAEIQHALAARGYDAGPADGQIGPKTRAAIRAFEVDHGIAATGEPTDWLVKALQPPRKLDPIVLSPPSSNAPDTKGATQQTTAPRQPIVIGSPTQQPTQQAAQQPAQQPPIAGNTVVNRNWLIQDLSASGDPIGPAFSVFLEANGHVAGPRFAERMRWEAVDGGIKLTYESQIGHLVTRMGRMASSNQIIGRATGPRETAWRWRAEAKPKAESPQS